MRVNFSLIPANAQTRKSLHPRKEAMRLATTLRKDADGKQHWYVEGISSGPVLDAHGERMSPACLDSFDQQVLEKTILFIHPHEDNLLDHHIGKVASTWRTDKGEWGVSMRLWDESDAGQIPADRIEKAKDFLNMIQGGGVYGKPVRISQFSVQGLLHKKNVQNNPDGTRVINDLQLDAIAAVSQGAYPQDDFSTVEKIFKQYDKLKKGEVSSELAEGTFEREFFEIESATIDALRDIMRSEDEPEAKKNRVSSALEEQKTLINELFSKLNYNLPAEGEEQTMLPQEEQQKPEGEKAAVDPNAAPAGQEEQKADTGAIAQTLTEAAKLIAQAAQALAGTGQQEEPATMSAVKAEDEKEDEEKKKQAPETPNTEENSEIEGVNDVKKALARLGFTKEQIAKQVQEIKKQANPTRLILERLDAMERSQAAMATSVAKGLSSLADMKVDIALPGKIERPSTQGHAALVAKAYEGMPEEVKKSLDAQGLMITAKPDITQKSAEPRGDSNLVNLQDAIKKSYNKTGAK